MENIPLYSRPILFTRDFCESFDSELCGEASGEGWSGEGCAGGE